eukprot:scaffold8274_cov157-Skeletonema_marinoi.AAC.3
MEAHPIGIYFPFFYSSWIRHPWVQDDMVTRWTMGDMFHLKFPQTYRKEDVMQNFRAKAGVGNGIVAIKYYPIDMYQLRYGSDGKDALEERIKEGVVLNDIAYWHMEGLVESWSKKTTIIDQENNTITGSDGRVASYDVLIEGGIPESPKLPPIHIMGDDGKKSHEFVYRYRESFLGVVPRTLHKNIFFLGLTRPTTGGIANMVEMQGLMVHKLLTQPKLLADLKETIEERVDQYNGYYYPEGRDETPTDHLVFYGFYTHEVAKFMGIDRLQNLWDNIKSWNLRNFVMNLRFELLTTNNAFKFRMDGEYCIEGAKEMALKYFEHFEHQAVLMYINANLLWDLLLGYVFLYMLLLQSNMDLQNATNHLSTLIGFDSSNTCSLVKWNHLDVSSSMAGVVASMTTFFGGCYLWYTKAPTIANQTFSLPVPMFGLKATFQPLFLVYTALYGSIYWLPAWFSGLALIGFLSRQWQLNIAPKKVYLAHPSIFLNKILCEQCEHLASLNRKTTEGKDDKNNNDNIETVFDDATSWALERSKTPVAVGRIAFDVLPNKPRPMTMRCMHSNEMHSGSSHNIVNITTCCGRVYSTCYAAGRIVNQSAAREATS